MKNLICPLLLATILSSGCTWVGAKPGADDILLLPERRVQNCENLGRVEVSVLAKVGGLDRHDDVIERDLQRLAKNHAVDKNGDTIAALSEVKDGEQRYGIYRCEGEETQAQPADEEDEEGVTVRSYNGGQ